MAYVSPNYKNKKQLKDALAAGRHVEVYQPGVGTIPDNGIVHLEGPHSPAHHTWYAEGVMQNGRLVKVK